MNRNFTKAVIISLLVHAVFFSFLIYYNIQGEEPFGSEFVSVEIIGDGTSGDVSSPPLQKGGEGVFENGRGAPLRAPTIPGGDRAPPLQASRVEPLNNGKLEQIGDGSALVTGAGDSNNAGGRTGSPGSATGNPILTKIRNKIERSKYYPQQARLQRLEGRPEVSFKIAPNGTVGSVQLIRSSGSPLLDSAAIETVNRAAPLPYYDGQISLAINFTLH